jgi:cytochrome c biogenesis protein CcmG/thiol:disulfide interchange protein DsbE
MKRAATLIVLLTLMIATNGILSFASDKSAPDFTLTDLSGNSISLSDFKGKVIFVNFWATWCPPCRQEIPDFIEFYKENKDSGAVILGVSVDKSTNEVRDFVEEYKINYPIVMATNEMVKDYKPGRYIPTTIIVDTDGMIQGKKVGIMDKATLEHYLKEYSGK